MSNRQQRYFHQQDNVHEITATLYTLSDQASIKPHPLLVDVTDTFLSGSISKSMSDRQQRNFHHDGNIHRRKSQNNSHQILWFNKPNWISLDKSSRYLENCSYTNCEFTTNTSLFRNSSAVIFCITTKGIETTPPLKPSERPANQVWVFFGMESPTHLDRFYKHLHPVWKNSFNWSMSYRINSDVVLPYGYLKTRPVTPLRNYSEIFRKKTKFVAWVVSNCNTPSLRKKFVEKLRKYGLHVDVYGACGMKFKGDPLTMISTDYKFYLSFENTMCSDYITEKFFKYFPLDVITVVRGGSDYKKLIPPYTYIDTADFDNFSKLVEHLKYLGSNEELYIEYLKRKDRYDSIFEIEDVDVSFCDLCAKLNNKENNRKVYETVPDYLDTCYTPDDIEKLDKI